MGWFDALRLPFSRQGGTSGRAVLDSGQGRGRGQVLAQAQVFAGLNDPAFLEFVRNGSVSLEGALKNSAVFRSVELITGAMGALPLCVMERVAGDLKPALGHSLHRVLMHRPNGWQSAFQFKSLMQHRALLHGNAYALIVRSGSRVVALQPIDTHRVTVDQRGDFSLRYRVSRPDGSFAELASDEVLHIRGVSDDGVTGVSRVRQAADVIGVGVASQLAAARMLENGMVLGGNLRHPGKLSKEAYERLQASMQQRHAGPENAGKWIITEEGMEAKPFQATASDAQLVELRAMVVDDIGRVFGVPRPLLGVSDTSWGSGIEQLAILFVRFGLSPWFRNWEDEIKVKCLSPSEWDDVFPDFQERELLRGTFKEQFEAFAKAAGSGGHMPWMEPNEIRDEIGLGPHKDGAGLRPAGERAP